MQPASTLQTDSPRGPSTRLLAALDRLCAALAWLALPFVLLLALQWPLRQTGWISPARVNDLAQGLFALLVAVALREAAAHGAHLASSTQAPRLPRLLRLGALLPWCLINLGLAAPAAWRSLLQWERFPETFSPGYFLIKWALLLLLLLLALQTLVELLAAPRRAS